MRKPEREITDPAEMRHVLEKALVCRIAMCDDGMPYMVPMSFGLGDGCLYMHSSPGGRKVEVLRENPAVCFEAEADVAVVEGEKPCNWTLRYRSVIGMGRAVFLEDREEKIAALTAVMDHYSGERDGEGAWEFQDKAVDRAAVIRIDILSMTGKKHGLDR